MAKVYSWEVVKSSVYDYIYNPIENKGAYVGPELKGDNLDKIINWAATVSDEVYDEHFDLMVKLCKEKGYDVNFDLAYAYRNVIGSCDNLRGPAGRGIESIYYRGTVLDEFNRNVDYYGIRYDDGTEDENGFYIRNGFDGKDGKDGIDGVNGIMGLSSITMIVYTSTEDETPPNRPVGGFYWFETGTFDCPDGWYVNDDNLSGVKWMSTKVFMSNNQNNPWSTPIRISGKDGENGRDGDTIEFIYKLGDDVNKIPKKPENNKDINDYIPEGWLDHPQGVDEINTVEWMCNRTKNTDANGNITWGDWSEPIAWSVFGVNGVDGDGIQYIFLKNRGEMPVNPTPENWEDMESAYQEKYAEFIPPVNESYTNKDGISIIFKPVKNVENNIDMGDAYVWTDSPSTLNTIYQYQWVSVRKYRNGKWTEYSKPALWGKYGENGTNGTAIIKIYKTHNSFNEPPTPPNSPTILGDWSMGFPKDYELGKNVVYSTECEVYLDSYEFVYRYKKIEDVDVTEDIIEKAATVESIPTDKYEDNDYIYCYESYYYWSGGWCKPYIVTGVVGENGASSKLIVIYTNKNEGEIPETPKGGDYDFDKFEFLYCPDDWYTSDDEFYGITWMSTRTFSSIKEYTDEEWSTPIRLTGERGVENKFFMIYTQSPEQPETPEDGAYDFSTRIFTCPEGWFINDDNFVKDPNIEDYSGYTWMSTRTFSSALTSTEEPSEDSIDNKWSTPVRLTGENGKDGQDGQSIEFIFKQSNREPYESDKPEEPANKYRDNFIPEGWEDHPQGIDDVNQYEWMCSRTPNKESIPNENGKYEWGNWSNPVIWSKYGVNGKDGDGVEYIYIRTVTNEPPQNPTPKNWDDSENNYQKINSEYLPPINENYKNINDVNCKWVNDGNNNNIWVDSPLDITEKYPYVWVCTRKTQNVAIPKGTDSKSIEYVFCYHNDIKNPPSKPNNKQEDNFIPEGWTDDSKGISLNNPYEWACKREKIIDESGNEIWGEWSEPYLFLYTGQSSWDIIKQWQPFSEPKLWSRFAYDGQDGQDGQSIEFIYKQSNREPDKPEEPTNKLEDDFIPEGWEDHPQGVDEINTVEWMCTRTRNKEPNENGNFEWGEWVGPVVWSKYGINGKDGDGVQYIFFKTRNREDIPKNPTPKDWKENEDYQNTDEEWIPKGVYENINQEVCTWGEEKSWVDSAPDIDEEFKYVWVCMRKYRTTEVEVDKNEFLKVSRWEEYSDPKLWAKYPEKGLDGPQGPAGIPGVSINFMFCLGTQEECFGTEEITNKNSSDIKKYAYWFDNDEIPSTKLFNIEVENERDIENELEKTYQNGFVGNVVEVKILKTNDVKYYYLIKNIDNSGNFYVSVTDEIKKDETNSVYLWCVQGRETNNNDTVITQWGKPFKLQGANGLKGMDGKKAPIIYPMGIYDLNTTYEATADKQPYVYDGSGDGGFYLYNDLNNLWKGVEENKETPAMHVSTGGTRWLVFEQFELLWSNVGVINNGLIGSAVFNNNFMFSQQGKDKDDGTGKYEQFLNGYTYKNDKWYYNDGITEVSKEKGTGRYLLNPYEKTDTGRYIHDFRPNVCINFETGEMWCGCGALYLYKGVVNVEESYLGTPPEQTINENTEGNNTAFDHPIKEGTGIFKGWNMEKFLGTPPMWDEKTGDKYEGTGVFKPVTTYIGTTPTINEDGSIANGTGVLGKSIKTVTDYVGTPASVDINGNLKPGNGLLGESITAVSDYIGTPTSYNYYGEKENDGTGLLKKVSNAMINYVGELPSIDSSGDLSKNNWGMLGKFADTLNDYIGTPPSYNGGDLNLGSGLLSKTTSGIKSYIGQAPALNNGSTIGGSGVLASLSKQLVTYIGTKPSIDSSGDMVGGTGLLGDSIKIVSDYIGTPTSYNYYGEKENDGTGLLKKVSNAMINYVGELPSIDSSGDLSKNNWGMLGKFADTLNDYIGTPPSYNGGDLNLGSGLLSKTTSGIKSYIGQAPALNNGSTIGGSGVLASLSKQLVTYIGTKPSIDSSGDMVGGTGLLGDSIKIVSDYIGTPPILYDDGSVKVNGTGKFKDIYDGIVAPIINPLKKQLDDIGQPAKVTPQGTIIGGTGLLAGLTQTSIDGKTGYSNMNVKNLILTGFLLKKPTIINDYNYTEFINTNDDYIDIDKCGSYVRYNLNGITSLYLPGNIGINYSSDFRQYIGETFAIYNISLKGSFNVTGSIIDGQSFSVGPNEMLFAECICDIKNGKEVVGWEIKKGEMKG